MSRTKIVTATVLVLVVVLGGAAYLWGPELLSGARDAGEDDAGGKKAGDSSAEAPIATPVPVRVAIAEVGELVKRITATGTAEADRKVRVAAEVAGRVEELAVEEGRRVAVGDLLVALDDTELRLKREEAREQFTSAMARFVELQAIVPGTANEQAERRALERFEEAERGFLGGFISEETYRAIVQDPELDEFFRELTREEVIASRVNLTQARVALQRAELDLARARIVAPFPGRIAELEVVPGQHLTAGTEVLTLVDADPIRLQVEVIESEIGMIEEGRRAEVTFAAYPDRSFIGRIESLSPLVDPERRTLEVTVRLANPEGRLRPGMFADVVLDARVFEDRLLVPTEAVLIRDERPLVFVVEEDRARWVYVETGLESPESVEILDGLSPGDRVIVGGHFSLAHDSPVRIVE